MKGRLVLCVWWLLLGASHQALTWTSLPFSALFPQFLLIFHKAAAGQLQEDSGLMALAKLSEIDVALEGVKGAKDFFEAKVSAFLGLSRRTH